MIHLCRTKVLLVAGLATLAVVVFVALRLESRPVFLPLGKEHAKVICVERLQGDNTATSASQRMKEWGRRQLDKLGFHLIGSRGGRINYSPDPKEDGHLVAVLCEGDFCQSPQTLRAFEDEMRRLLAECIDDENSVPLRPYKCVPGEAGQVWFIWKYSDLEIFKPFPTSNSAVPTSGFFPTHLIMMPRVGATELVVLPMTN